MDYIIELGTYRLGITKLDKADPPMGVVFGAIIFDDPTIGYAFIKEFCEINQVELAEDLPSERFISTMTIEGLTIKNSNGIEITGLGNQISGMDDLGFEISILGIPYPFYEEEFPHHVKSYR